jgi:CheY-like chemotaxis protein
MQQLKILVIENDPAAARLTKEALHEAGLRDGVAAVENGEEALLYLRAQGRFRDRVHPHVIFLDLHLPKITGLEVLEILKTSKELAVTPVVVVSGSADPQEVRKAYELHASCYIRKPDDLDQFLQFMRICFEFWGTVVTLPVAG